MTDKDFEWIGDLARAAVWMVVLTPVACAAGVVIGVLVARCWL